MVLQMDGFCQIAFPVTEGFHALIVPHVQVTCATAHIHKTYLPYMYLHELEKTYTTTDTDTQMLENQTYLAQSCVTFRAVFANAISPNHGVSWRCDRTPRA